MCIYIYIYTYVCVLILRIHIMEFEYPVAYVLVALFFVLGYVHMHRRAQ